ncbi:MAG: HlyD family type I secretion periplasmic adaptor subunit, partial [Rhizobiales bacterium]|nr:HlyD family type I secretion periplasmic adaptor subunit [Hyphomicrobiales bacterium]
GDIVKKGDVLISLDDIALKANLSIVEHKLVEYSINRLSLIAQRNGQKEFTLPANFIKNSSHINTESLLASQKSLLVAKVDMKNAQISQLKKRIEQNNELTTGLGALQKTKHQQLEITNTELASLTSLAKGGHLAKSQVQLKKKESLQIEGEIAERLHEIARIKTSNGETEIQILQINQDYLEKTLSELKQMDSQIQELKQQKIAAVSQLNRIEITTPISGIVHNSQIHTNGGVVTPATPLMQIIPQNKNLIIETKLEPINIDQVYLGQSASVRLSAFNQKTTPELTGTIKNISANVIQDQTTGALYYQVIVHISEAELSKITELKLIPGMPAEVFIKTKDRTALNYLIKPFGDQLNRAFREE